MADSELSALTEDTTPDETDWVYLVDSTGTTDKKVSLGNVRGAISTYTPTWAGGSPSIGDGILAGAYSEIHPGLLWFRIYQEWGSTTNNGSGGITYTWSLPGGFTSSNNTPGTRQIVNAYALDSSASQRFIGHGLIGNNQTTVGVTTLHRSTTVGDVATSSQPFTWANGDYLILEGTIQVQ